MKQRSLRFFVLLGAFIFVFANCISELSAQQNPSSSGRNQWIGLWEGEDADGSIYSFTFLNDTSWEAYFENSGIAFPFYRGTYTYTSSRVVLQITEEGDSNTLKWVKVKQTFPPLTCRLVSGKLNMDIFGVVLEKE